MSETTPEVSAAPPIHRTKQRTKRANVRVPIRISTIDPEKDPETGKLYFYTSQEVSANISRGGAFVATPEPIDPGRRVLVEIDIPNGSNIQTIGRVVWKRIDPTMAESSPAGRTGIGIQFTGGRPDLLNELDRFINLTGPRRSKTSDFAPPNSPAT
jgi:Tfp pilus assembly protein PilZ